MEIGNLEEFIYQIKTIDQCEDGYVRFYRGQPVDKPLIPNAFRDQCFIDNESDIYNEIVNKKPGEFTNCKCTFDYLVKMQHYNIPTRLLDITTNPLVALYFACSGEPDEHAPTVYCIDIPFDRIKNYTSDSVTILSSLARYDKESKEHLILNNEKLHSVRKIFIKYISEVADHIKTLDYISFIQKKNEIALDLATKMANTRIKCDREIIREFIDFRYSNSSEFISEIENALSSVFSDNVNVTTDMIVNSRIWQIYDKRLLHEVKQDKPYFLDLMHIDTFNTIYCVKPRLDNPRIIKQNGAFLIFPHAKIKLEDDIRTTKISIDKKIMTSIKEDLSKIDINEESLFDDMDTVCLAIKDRYRKLNK